MHQIARDLRLTYLYREFNGQIEYIFTKDKTESLNYNGLIFQIKNNQLKIFFSVRRIVLVDRGDKIQISEVSSEGIISSENWAKTNLTQVMWAIRGKCQKTLCN